MDQVMCVWMSISVGVLIAGMAALYALMPRWTRPELYFAVTVPASFRDDPRGREIRASYLGVLAIHTVLAFAVAALAGAIGRASSMPLALVWLTLGATHAFLRARRRVQPHAVAPTTVREASLVRPRASLPGGPIAQLGPFALLALAATWLALRWDALPLRFPLHWDLAGHADRFGQRSLADVYGGLLNGIVVCAVLALLAHAVLRSTRRISVTGESGAREQRFRRAVLGVLLGAEYLVACTFAGLALLPMLDASAGTMSLGLSGGAIAFSVVAVVALARLGHGYGRAATSAAPIGDRTADEHWRWGLFYFNPKDTALLVEKRFGIGFTLNFAARGAWLLLGVVLLVPLATWIARR